MRVNLSYSVDLKEVLPELSDLFSREKAKFDTIDKNAMKMLKEKYTDANIREVFNVLEDYKTALSNLDIKLGEIQHIIKGYYDIINAPLEDSADGATDDGNDDEV